MIILRSIETLALWNYSIVSADTLLYSRCDKWYVGLLGLLRLVLCPRGMFALLIVQRFARVEKWDLFELRYRA